MEFKNIGDLVNQINTALGEFCNEFGRKRKELAGMGKVPKRGILFKYEDNTRDWAINEGGGTEIQYHIAFKEDDCEIRYGLGFNTQTVQFKYEMSSVEYMQPFMSGFLKNEQKIREILPVYDFVYGNIEQLRNPQHDQYTLFGKSVEVQERGDKYFIDDADFQNILTDLRNQFEAYQIIFTEKNNFKKVAMNIHNSIDILTSKGQIILQGPPGTGKTYTAKDIAEKIIFDTITDDKKEQKKNLESTDQFKLIQFHPAYSYEDFVRGIIAKANGDSIEYKTINKLLAAFAKTANTNFQNSIKAPTVYSREKWIEDKFNLFVEEIEEKLETDDKIELTKKVSIFDTDEDAFRYKGQEGWVKNGNRMLFSDIKKAYFDRNEERQDIKKNTSLSGLAHHHASYYVRVLDLFKAFLSKNNLVYTDLVGENENLKKYVLIVDEINRANLPAVLGELIYALEYRGEKVDSMYATLEDGNTIVIPPNLFIIGTMNTSDRSVGHIDYAIRRRFAFIDVLPKILPGDNFQSELFRKVSELFISNFDEYVNNNSVELRMSEHLSEEFRPEDVWLGHSYFIKGESDFELRKKYEIVPILKEYLKDGILKQTALPIINDL